MPNFSNYAEQLAAHTKIFHGKDTNKPSAKANISPHLDRTKSTRKRILSKEQFPDRFFGKYPLTFDSVFPARSGFTTF